MRKLLAVLVLVSSVCLAQAPKPASPAIPGVPAAMNAIDAERIRAQTRFLADDLLEGRGTGQRGGDLAARYLAAEFELYGLKPAGDDGTYFQKVALVGVKTDPKESRYALVPQKGAAMPLRFAEDYVVNNHTQTEVVDVDAPIVFVGYGIEAPEYGWNDYKDADVKGKVVMMFVNEPPSDDAKFFTGPALTYYGRWTYKYEQAARKGAVGAILIHKTEMASYGWEVVRNSWSGERSAADAAGKGNQLKAASWVQLEVARKALAAAGQDLDKLLADARSRDFQPIALPLALKAHVVSKVRRFHTSNVVAMLPGSDPKLKEQAIFYTAHYDHFGVRPEEKGDNIYNGALDNATGCAMVLELARAWSLARPRPKRSIYFAMVGAEEQGLLGSEYLGKNPPLPANNIQLGINLDAIAPYGHPEEVEMVGYDRTTFGPMVEQVAKAFGLRIMPDANPSAGLYYRSDHFSFARVGVPAFSVGAGRKFRGKTKEWGDQMADAYTAKDYHKPSDDFRADWDFTANVVLAKLGFALGWKAAQMPAQIQWKPGDEFEKARKQAAVRLPDIYRRWLDEEARFLIEPEEKAKLLAAKTDQERDDVVRHFWEQRDPTPGTDVNEFKQEHYRRIAYSNQHFAFRGMGSLTDRGRVYIVCGPPDKVEDSMDSSTGHRIQIWSFLHGESCHGPFQATFVDVCDCGDYRYQVPLELRNDLLYQPRRSKLAPMPNR